jgi:hypothetical protein
VLLSVCPRYPNTFALKGFVKNLEEETDAVVKEGAESIMGVGMVEHHEQEPLLGGLGEVGAAQEEVVEDRKPVEDEFVISKQESKGTKKRGAPYVMSLFAFCR